MNIEVTSGHCRYPSALTKSNAGCGRLLHRLHQEWTDGTSLLDSDLLPADPE